MVLDQRHVEFPPTRHPTTVALYEYWLEKCGDRPMPMRSDIDPTSMPRRARGNDPTARSVLEGFFAPTAEDALACYDRVVSTRAPLLDPTPFIAPGGRYVTE